MNMEQMTQPETVAGMPAKVISSPDSDFSLTAPVEVKTSFANEDERRQYRQEEKRLLNIIGNKLSALRKER